MKNLKDLFVSKEIAIKLKEKGFNEPCLTVYRGGNLYFDKMVSGYVSDLSENTDFSTNSSLDNFSVNEKDRYYWITAPMLSQVIDWFREKHNIDLLLGKDDSEYRFEVHFGSEYKSFPDKDYYKALNKAIEEALKLI